MRCVMDALKQIVVGIDFSESSRTALAQAVRLGKKFGAAVRAVHVVEKGKLEEVAASLPHAPGDLEARVAGQARYGIERMVSEIAGEGASGVSVETLVGPASHTLVRIAEEVGGGHATLLVMGNTGQEHPRAGVGTTAGRCVRHGAMDVLLVRQDEPGASPPYRNIVVCVDFSETSIRALHLAARLAREDGAELRVVHVFSPPPPAYPPADMIGMWPIPAPDYGELTERLRESATEGLSELLAREEPGARATPVVVEDSSYGRGICEYAKGAGADLVVIGTHGRTNLRYLLLGSTAEKVLKEVHCSVLAVKPHSEKGAGA